MDITQAITNAANRQIRHGAPLPKIYPLKLYQACGCDPYRALTAAITITQLRRQQRQAA
jgi:hypothetical protein